MLNNKLMSAFAALAEPNRRQIVELLARYKRLPASQISQHFKASKPAISQHLKVLREANLVQVEAQGQQRIYSLNPTGFAEIETWIAQLHQQWDQRFDKLEQLLRDD